MEQHRDRPGHPFASRIIPADTLTERALHHFMAIRSADVEQERVGPDAFKREIICQNEIVSAQNRVMQLADVVPRIPEYVRLSCFDVSARVYQSHGPAPKIVENVAEAEVAVQNSGIVFAEGTDHRGHSLNKLIRRGHNSAIQDPRMIGVDPSAVREAMKPFHGLVMIQ